MTGRALQRGDPADLRLSDTEDPRVRGDHDHHGNVEANERRRYRVRAVQISFAVLLANVSINAIARANRVSLRHALVCLVPVELDGDEGDEHGERPGHAYHHEGHAPRHLALVAKRTSDRPVAVHANDAQVQDGRRGTHDVEGHPDGAEAAEEPRPRHRRHGLEGHHQQRHQEVRHRQ